MPKEAVTVRSDAQVYGSLISVGIHTDRGQINISCPSLLHRSKRQHPTHPPIHHLHYHPLNKNTIITVTILMIIIKILSLSKASNYHYYYIFYNNYNHH